jgi:hypothetical protein
VTRKKQPAAPPPPETTDAPQPTEVSVVSALNEVVTHGLKLLSVVGDQRCSAIAKTKLEEYAMWTTRGLLLAQRAKNANPGE